MYVVAEKILSGRERLPSQWQVHGTTGYNFLNDVNGLFVDTSQARRLRRTYAKLTGHLDSFEDVLYESKRLIMNTAMASELNVLGHMLDRIGAGNRKSRDFTLDSLRDVITEVVACFPVYRTYVDERGWTPEDRAVVEQAISQARRRNPAMESSLFDFFREVDAAARPVRLPRRRRGRAPRWLSAGRRRRSRRAAAIRDEAAAVHRTGPGERARRHGVLSLQRADIAERGRRRSVADRPLAAGLSRREPAPCVRLAVRDAGDRRPTTRSSAKTCARGSMFSPRCRRSGPARSSRWMRLNRTHRSIVDGGPAPDRADEYRLYQILDRRRWPGSRPELATSGPSDLRTYVDRIREYMTKAVREAKVHTSWLTTNPGYEEGLARFIERALGQAGGRFLAAFLPFQRRIAAMAVTNSLAQVVLKIGSPGVPDFYQGTELWDLSLVDPDNRRPVDFEHRERLLTRTRTRQTPSDIAATAVDLAGRQDQAVRHDRRAARPARAATRVSSAATTCRSPRR